MLKYIAFGFTITGIVIVTALLVHALLALYYGGEVMKDEEEKH